MTSLITTKMFLLLCTFLSGMFCWQDNRVLAAQQQEQENRNYTLASVSEKGFFFPVHTYEKQIDELQKIIATEMKNQPVKEVMEEIAKKADLGLMYNPLLHSLDKKIDFKHGQITAGRALILALEGTGYEAVISKNKEIVVMRRVTPDELTDELYDFEITGEVTDAESGEMLPGVSVYVEDTQIGTTTNLEGRYTLNVPDDAETLVFSFVGYRQQQVEIAGRTTIDIELAPDVIMGEEMVVTAFGIEREARGLTYSTQGVSPEQMSEARELNLMNSLQGKVSGLNITQSSQGVGSPTRVVLRGNRSFTGSNEPLYVVDGVPIRGNPQDLSPDEIESMDVLKGPNAAALYGSAAQNGAIVITTRRGTSGATQISFSQTLTAETPILATPYQNEFGQGNGGVYDPNTEFNWGPRMDGSQVDYWSPDPAREGESYSFAPQPDNVRDIFRTGYNSATNLNASIGSENIQTLFSYTYTQAEGMVPNNDLNRHNISLRVNAQLSERLALDSRLSYMRQVVDNQLSTGENFANPLRHIYRIPRNVSNAAMSEYEYFDDSGNRYQHFWNPGSNGGANPYWTLNRNLNQNIRDRVIGMASLTYNFSETLSLLARASYDGLYTNSETRLYNDTYVIAPNGSYSLGKSNFLEWNGDFLLSYEDDVSEDWSLSANFGGNIQQRRNNSLSANTGPISVGLTAPNFFTLSNTQDVAASNSIGAPRDVQSLYGFGQIGWRQSLFLDFSGRNDWSSTLPADSRSFFYPSVGLSAVLSDLIPEFPAFFDLARVRASYAEVGNSAPAFSLRRTASFTAGGNNGFLSLDTTIPNADLRPERTESIELGADLRVLGGRLGLDFTWYKMNTTDQLFAVALPVGSGASQFFTNGGNVENKGVEFLLSVTPVQTAGFNWDVDVNFARNRNMVVEIDESLDLPHLSISQDFMRVFRIEEGEPYGQVYSRGWERDDQGRVIVGSNGLPQVTDGFNVPVANFNPDWTGSISSQISFKNFSASFLIDHRQGGSIVSITNAILDADGLTERTLRGRDGGLVFGDNFFSGETAVMQTGEDAGGNPIYEPNTHTTDAETFWKAVGGRNAPVGEAFVEEATNTRLREVTLGYTLPASLLSSWPVSNVKISVVGRNLFFLYRASDTLDPDNMVNTQNFFEGFESFTPPTARSFGLNLQVDF